MILLPLALPQSPLPFLSPAFGSHMVMQRDKLNTFWGWTSPGESVTVSVAGKKASGVADASGKWVVRIAPPPTGGPYTVDVDGTQHVTLDDVLVGDVWICGGQSNMEMGIAGVNNAQQEIAGADRPTIRLFTVEKNAMPAPTNTMTGQWQVCSPTTVATGGWGGFSAVGYFFGRELSERLKVPIGLVASNWGGTIAEAWTSRPGLADFPEFAPALDSLQAMVGTSPEQRLDLWASSNDPGSKEHWENDSFDDSAWSVAPSPTYEAVGQNTFDGVLWFRYTFEMPTPMPSGSATLDLGDIDDIGTVWVNGLKVGNSYLGIGPRSFPLSTNYFHSGKNTIAVRMIDTGGPGGFAGGASQMLRIGSSAMPLDKGQWRWARGASLAQSTPLPMMGGNPNVPSVLYNGMISPLVPLAIKGAIWYQGESNAGRAQQYQKLLPAMIADWRQSFGQGDFPFLIVQLANFQVRHDQPVEDAWAELREAQAMTAKTVKNSGLAVAIDIGDRNDIHPKDKQTVGLRLALQAMHVAYGRNDLEYSGPVFKSAHRSGSKLVLSFEHARGLNAHGELKGFQVAGADGTFHWADAHIEGERVVVSSPDVAEPTYVRYAWDTDPEATLYNGAGLPAVPFRTR